MDGDSIYHILDSDDDGDGIPTQTERNSCSHLLPLIISAPSPTPLFINCRPRWRDFDTDQDGIPDFRGTNSDGDSFDDENPSELLLDLDGNRIPNPYAPNENDGPIADPDGDGYNNWQESILGTHPFNEDSDGDGLHDPYEVGPRIRRP